MSKSPLKIEVYSTSYCPYCTAAKNLLSDKSLDFEEVDISNDFEKRNWLIETTGQRTVPQIFINDKSIGGFQELSAFDQSGELDRLISSLQAE